MPEYQPCSVAHLMSVVFGLPLEQTFPAAGLKLCEVCGKASTRPEWYPFCGESHWRKVNEPVWVDVACAECGKLTRKRLCDIKHTNLSYCSHSCLGKMLGRTVGFTAHPENMEKGRRPLGTHCKRGHERTEVNTYSYQRPNGRVDKDCRKCRDDRKKAWDKEQRHANQEQH